MISNFETFKESVKYDYGCVLANIEFENWKDITSVIDKKDIYKSKDIKGLEDNPHVTLLYGLHSNVSKNDIISALEGVNFSNLIIEVSGISIFESGKFDVVKFGIVKNPILYNIFEKLSLLPNSNEFSNYVPHITIAYVKSGMGKKYISSEFFVKNIKSVIYSKPNSQNSTIYKDLT